MERERVVVGMSRVVMCREAKRRCIKGCVVEEGKRERDGRQNQSTRSRRRDAPTHEFMRVVTTHDSTASLASLDVGSTRSQRC